PRGPLKSAAKAFESRKEEIYAPDCCPVKEQHEGKRQNLPKLQAFSHTGELFGRKENKRSANALSRYRDDPCGGMDTARCESPVSVQPSPPRGRRSAA